MKRKLLHIALLACCIAASAVHAASFTYHGTLQDGGVPAEGSYDLQLTLYSAPSGGLIVGGPLEIYAVPVHHGAFNAQVDFGALAKSPDAAWLGVALRGANMKDFTILGARSPVRVAATDSSICPGAWTLEGNAGTSGKILGTVDAVPLNLFAGGEIALALSAPGTSAGGVLGGYNGTNVVAGNSVNHITGSVGAVIAGGGGYSSSDDGGNNVLQGGDFAAIGGGLGNNTNGAAATIAGGFQNSASGAFSFAAGYQNVAFGLASVALGADSWAIADYSFAAGHFAYVGDASKQGSFVWSDATGSSDNRFGPTGPNQFLLRAGGGAAINGTPLSSNVELTVNGSATTGNGDDNTDLVLLPRAATEGYDLVAAKADSSFAIYRTSNFGTPALKLDASANLSIAGSNAYKATASGWLASSDRRIKERIAPVESALDTLARLQPMSFHYNAAYRAAHGNFADQPFFGFIAQDYAKVFPAAVVSTGEQLPGATGAQPPVLALDDEPALITTVAAVQELDAQVQALRAQNDALQAQNDAQKHTLDRVLARLARLESQRSP